jgi:hypothetical protein
MHINGMTRCQFLVFVNIILSLPHVVSLNHAQFSNKNLDAAALGSGKAGRWGIVVASEM